MTTNHVLIAGLVIIALIVAALPLARRAVLLLTTKYLVKRRLAWVSLIAVALCVALVLIVLSVMSGWLESFRSSFRSMTGDLIVSRSGSMGGFPYYDQMIAELEQQPEVAAAAPIIRTAGLLAFPQVQRGWQKYVEVVGVPDIQRMDRVMPFTESLWLQHDSAAVNADGKPKRSPASFELWPDVDYALAAPDDRRPRQHPGMIVGMGSIGVETDRKTGNSKWQTGLTSMLGQITVVPSADTVSASGPINANTAVFWIVDGSRTQTMQHDRNVYVPFGALQTMLGLAETSHGVDIDTGKPVIEPARTTEVHIRLKPGVDADGYKAKVKQIVDAVEARAVFAASGVDPTTQPTRLPALAGFGGLIVETWEDQQRQFLDAVENEITIMMVLFGLISLVAVFMIFCIFYTIVAEKTRDVGILKSVGASGWNVAQIFLTYGAAIGFVGGSAGVFLGWLFLRYINEINEGIGRLTGTPIYNSEVYALDKLPTTINWSEAVIIWIIGILAAIVGATVPAIRAARLRPVEALRFE